MTPPPLTVGRHALVSCGSFRAHFSPGDTLTFGRGHGHPLRIGHVPEDLRVPRFAGKLECRDDGVLVHNTSERGTLTVQTFPGPGYDVLPLMIAGTHPHAQVRVVLTGRAGTYAITVDTRPLGPRPGPSPSAMGGATIGFERIPTLSRRHRILLSALCLPMLTRSGRSAEVPTYAEMEQILLRYGRSYRAKTIKNGLDELRTLLTSEHGVEGLLRAEGEEEVPGATPHLVGALARWAVVSGNVTDVDLDALQADDGEWPGPG